MNLNLKHIKLKINQYKLFNKVNEKLGKSLFIYLKSRIEKDKKNSDRLFYSIKNIDNHILREFIKFFEEEFKIEEGKYRFEDFNLKLVTIDEIDGFSYLKIPQNTTATYYRDNLNENEILILILNRETSDSQSLKNIFEINENSLAENSWRIIKNTIYEDFKISFGETDDDLEEILKIIDKELVFNKSLLQVATFIYLVSVAYKHNNKEFLESIYNSFPVLKLFRVKQYLNPKKDKEKLKKLLKNMEDFYVNHLNLESKEIKKYVEKIEKLNIPAKEFRNDFIIHDKICDESKVRKILIDFIQTNSEDALFLEWEDYILPLLGRKVTSKESPCLKEIENLIETLENNKFLSEILEKLRKKKPIFPEEAEKIIEEYELSSQCKRFFKKFTKLKDIRGYDLELLLLRAIVELKNNIENNLADIQINIYIEKKDSEINEDFKKIFNLFYKNLDKSLSNEKINIDFSALDELELTEKKKELKIKTELVEKNTSKLLKSINIIWTPNNLMEITYHYVNSLKETGEIFNYLLEESSISLDEIDVAHLKNAKFSFILKDLKSYLLDDNQNLTSLLENLQNLEDEYKSLIKNLGQNYGLVTASKEIDKILDLYNSILNFLDKKLEDYDLIKKIYPLILNLFSIKIASVSIIMSILHPLKLLWLRNKFINISKHIKEILEEVKNIGDEKIFVENMENIYSSKLYPAISINFVDVGKSTYFSSEQEKNGFELYKYVEANNSFSFEYELEKKAKKLLNSTLDHYLTLYPYRKDNINICFFDLKNTDLLREISNYDKGFYKKRLFIYTSEQAIKIYETIKKFIENNEIRIEKPPYSIFPNIEYEIHQKNKEIFLNEAEEKNIDIGFLYKFYDDKNTQIIPKKEKFEPQNIEETFPPIQMIQEPYEKGSSTKKRTLNHFNTSEIVKNFYNLCYIFEETIQHQGRDLLSDINKDNVIIFSESFEFDKEKEFIGKIHEKFNWVVFYEKNVDKEVIERSLKESAVIKYFANVGEKGEYNFLISTRKSKTLFNKIKESLKEYIPLTNLEEDIVQALINEAKKISGDLILKATNLGYFFNELFGAVLSKIEIEKELKNTHLLSWIYMDDVSHWYASKSKGRPDIAAINIKIENGKTIVNMHLTEAKFINSNSLDSTKKEVVCQLKNGYERFKKLFSPNAPNLDSFFWYYSLYNTVISKLDFMSNTSDEYMNKIKKDILSTGNFELDIKLHAYIYCYDYEKDSEDYSENYEDAEINFNIRYKGSIVNLLKNLSQKHNKLASIEDIQVNSKINTQDKLSFQKEEKIKMQNLHQKQEELKQEAKAAIQTSKKLPPEKEKPQIYKSKDPIDIEINEIFKNFIGNEAAIRKIKTFIKHAYRQTPKKLPKNIIFTGEASTGKTHLSKLIAKALKLPLFTISAPALDNLDTLLERMEHTVKEHNLHLEKIGESGGLPVVKFPPMIVFIDEAHKLKPKLQEELLTALEPKDRKAYASKYIADLSDVTFLFATTEKGELINPLKTRLTFIELKPYSKEEVIQILKKNYPNLPENVLERIAIAGRLVPRVALELASDLIIESEAHSIEPTVELLEDAILKVNEIDEIGLSYKDRKYLEILNKADREIGVSNIANQLGVGESEIIEDIEPYLLRLGFIERTKSGRKITSKGKEYLRRFKSKSQSQLN
ncbi:Holliday junction DNA helicase RuvB C-terminal domain-containing protein [Persephonella sp. IF05-L8]|uniref:Holliday junction DNA helicase RuvB C-terminal domain-containing protein n=1 Tax=Persephonella sp. IF05-L8 TaxID=1158338 RepID=UPI0004958CF1